MYYHGSNHYFSEKFIKPVNEYTSSESVKDIEELFESVRPSHCIPRTNCVFLTKSIEDIDYAGGYTDYIYLVSVENINSSDLAWYSKASCQLSDGDIQGAIKSAIKYWSGDIFEIAKHSLFEYRSNCALIIKEVDCD